MPYMAFMSSTHIRPGVAGLAALQAKGEELLYFCQVEQVQGDLWAVKNDSHRANRYVGAYLGAQVEVQDAPQTSLT